MDDFVVREQLLAHVTHDEPPMTLTSAGLLAQGARRKMFRVSGMTGAALTAVALVAVLLYAPPSGSAPPAGAISAEAACLARVPLVIGATPDITADPMVNMSPPVKLPPTPPPFDSDLKTRVTCYLVDTVPAMLPGVRFLPATWRGDLSFQMIEFFSGLRMYARTPTGGVGVSITRANDPATKLDPSADARGIVEKLPDGTMVTVYDDRNIMGDGTSRHLMVVVTTGRTQISVSADNVRAVRPDPVSGGEPLLTKEQLIQLATAPRLAIFG